MSVVLQLLPLLPLQGEAREDQEQNKKLADTIELLLAAGYFRARIKGLTPFDKVRVLLVATCMYDNIILYCFI